MGNVFVFHRISTLGARGLKTDLGREGHWCIEMPGARYSAVFKSKMVGKLLHPSGPSAWALAQESGVTYTTLSRWIAEARNLSDMSEQEPDTGKRKRWTTEEKLCIVTQASGLARIIRESC